MKYTREELINYPIGKLIDIIMSLQDDVDASMEYKKIVHKIAKILEPDVRSDKDDVRDNGEERHTMPSRRGRKPFTPEQKAAAYEEYKRKKREAYAENKNKQ